MLVSGGRVVWRLFLVDLLLCLRLPFPKPKSKIQLCFGQSSSTCNPRRSFKDVRQVMCPHDRVTIMEAIAVRDLSCQANHAKEVSLVPKIQLWFGTPPSTTIMGCQSTP